MSSATPECNKRKNVVDRCSSVAAFSIRRWRRRWMLTDAHRSQCSKIDKGLGRGECLMSYLTKLATIVPAGRC
jgi:hypothetical protein